MALRNIAIMLVLTILYELSDSTFFDGRCCVRIPRAMDINTFQSRVSYINDLDIKSLDVGSQDL